LLEELPTVPAAARLSLESIRSDVRSLSEKLKAVGEKITGKTDRFFDEISCHFANSEEHVENMEERLEQMDSLISFLAAYFCEEKNQFKIEECFKILFTFTCRLRSALNISKFVLQDNEARLRRQQRREECLNAKSALAHSSSELDLTKRSGANNTKTLFELLEKSE
uniref:FH2 domain-containing protein n=1 Tax=Gongylonema pulchrum TaxID=637853 RepID=A0A183D8I1_9BILA